MQREKDLQDHEDMLASHERENERHKEKMKSQKKRVKNDLEAQMVMN